MLRFFTSHSTIFSHNTHCCTDCNNATTTTEKPVSAPSKIVDIFGFLLSTCLTLLIFGTFSGFFLCAEIMAWVLRLLALSTMFLFVYSIPFLMSQALNFIFKSNKPKFGTEVYAPKSDDQDNRKCNCHRRRNIKKGRTCFYCNLGLLPHIYVRTHVYVYVYMYIAYMPGCMRTHVRFAFA